MSIEAYPSPNGVLTSLIWRKTAAGGETSLSGYDNASQALSYTPGQEQVYLNGILLVRGSDYTATNGTSITGLTALAADDFVQINCYNNFSVASVPAASITGEVTNSQITSLATTKLTGTITNAQLAGSIANDKLANSSITINGSAVALGGSATIAGGSAQDTAPSSPTEGQLWLDTDGTLASTAFVEKSVLTTTGDVLYASSANTPARLGIGSNGQVLGISSGVPAWTTPSSGGMTLLSTTSLTGNSVTISGISGSYKNLFIYGRNIYMTANDNLNMRLNSVTTSSYSMGRLRLTGATVVGFSTTQTYIEIAEVDTSSTWDQTGYFYITIPRYAESELKSYWCESVGRSPSALKSDWRHGVFNSTSAITSVTVYCEAGGTNFSGGTVYVYGVS